MSGELIAKVSLAETTPKQFVLDCADAVHVIRLHAIEVEPEQDYRASLLKENEGWHQAKEAVTHSWDAADRATQESIVVIGYGALCKAALNRNLDVECTLDGEEIDLPPIALIGEHLRDDMTGALLRVVTR